MHTRRRTRPATASYLTTAACLVVSCVVPPSLVVEVSLRADVPQDLSALEFELYRQDSFLAKRRFELDAPAWPQSVTLVMRDSDPAPVRVSVLGWRAGRIEGSGQGDGEPSTRRPLTTLRVELARSFCSDATSETDEQMCARIGKDCDDVTASDSCGLRRTVHCGTCAAPATCGGSGTANVCGCTPVCLVCGASDRCNGTCSTGACSPGKFCDAGACLCSLGRTDCGDACADLRVDSANCGSCGRSCPYGCDGGACQCPGGRTYCGSVCVDLRSDKANCGACSKTCAYACDAGACECPGGQTDCSGACVDLRTDSMNCGACGKTCPHAAAHDGGACAGAICMCADLDDNADGHCCPPGLTLQATYPAPGLVNCYSAIRGPATPTSAVQDCRAILASTPKACVGNGRSTTYYNADGAPLGACGAFYGYCQASATVDGGYTCGYAQFISGGRTSGGALCNASCDGGPPACDCQSCTGCSYGCMLPYFCTLNPLGPREKACRNDDSCPPGMVCDTDGGTCVDGGQACCTDEDCFAGGGASCRERGLYGVTGLCQ